MSSPTDTATLVDVVMPQLGTSMSEGTVLGWLKEVGEEIQADEPICELSTDKIDSECPAPAAGTLAEVLVGAGETVEVGTVLGRIATAGGTEGGASVAPPENGAEPAGPEPSAGAKPAPEASDSRRRYSPLVRRIAADHGIDLAGVSGSGRGGRVTKRDVMAAVEQGPTKTPSSEPALHSDSPYRPDPEPAPAGAAAADELGGVAQPLPHIRQAIGNAMLSSQRTAATCHTVVECDMERVERRRRELGLTALPLVCRATIETLREFPDLNATLDGTTIVRYERVHLGVAVSLGSEGLIVPVIRDAQELSLEGLGARIADLATRARAKQLDHDEVQGATFTITNPGRYGALIATPVLSQPQVGILDLEAISKRPVVVEDADGGDSIAIRRVANLILGWDHRAMDGVYAASFLSALRERLERVE